MQQQKQKKTPDTKTKLIVNLNRPNFPTPTLKKITETKNHLIKFTKNIRKWTTAYTIVFIITSLVLHFHIYWLLAVTSMTSLALLSLLNFTKTSLIIILLKRDPTKHIKRIKTQLCLLQISIFLLILAILGFGVGIGYYKFRALNGDWGYLKIYAIVMICIFPIFLPLPIFLGNYFCRIKGLTKRIEAFKGEGMKWRSMGQFYIDYDREEITRRTLMWDSINSASIAADMLSYDKTESLLRGVRDSRGVRQDDGN